MEFVADLLAVESLD
jgi:Co/Zn/Cd efflux system component